MAKSPTGIYGDTLLIHSSGFSQKIVRWWINSVVDHTACMVGADLIWDARPKHGVTPHSSTEWNNVPWIIIRPQTAITEEMKNNGLNWLEKQKGKKYDFSGIAGYPLNNDELQDPQKWTCSELTRRWYKSMGIRIVKRTPLGFTNPQTVLGSLEFYIVDHNLNEPNLLKFIKKPIIEVLKSACNIS